MVESSGLLNRRRPLKSTGGSNPPLSASPNNREDLCGVDLLGRVPFLILAKTRFANPLLIRLPLQERALAAS